jgi:hypothetical protein
VEVVAIVVVRREPSVHTATAAVAARAAGAGRCVGLTFAYGDNRHDALEILGLASRARRFGVTEDELLELTRTLATHILV